MSSGYVRIVAKKNLMMIRRYFCINNKSVALPQLHQGSTLSIHSHVPVTSVRFEPAWRDYGHVHFQQVVLAESVNDVDQTKKMKRSSNQHHQQQQPDEEQRVEMIVSLEKDQMTSLGRTESHVSVVLQPEITSTAAVSESSSTSNVILENESTESECHVELEEREHNNETPPGIYLTVQIPEKVNISCELNHGGSIFIPNGKVEGDVRLVTTHGNIHVKKLRGQHLELKATGSTSNINDTTIVVSDLLEAQKLVMETTGRIRVKQIHTHTANIIVNAASKSSSSLLDTSSLQEVDDEGSLIDISSFYISGSGGTGDGGGATLLVQGPCQPQRRAVRVKSHHGALQVETHQIFKPREVNVLTKQIYPIIELGGVNGNVEVSIKNMMMRKQQQQEEESSLSYGVLDENENENENHNDTSWSSCCVHVDSLSQDSVSLISVDSSGHGDGGGDVSLTLDRKVEADLRFASISRRVNTDSCLDEVSALLADEEDENLVVQVLKHLPNNINKTTTPLDDDSQQQQQQQQQQVESRIDIDTTAFTPLSTSSSASFISDTLEYVQGWVENKSHEPDSRFERKVRGGVDENTSGGSSTSGKIRITSAAQQALHGFTANNNDKTEEDNTVSSSSSYLRPLLAVVVNNGGRIKVETVSWLGAIARRYGLEETDERRRDVGRTAAKRGRPFAWSNNE